MAKNNTPNQPKPTNNTGVKPNQVIQSNPRLVKENFGKGKKTK